MHRLIDIGWNAANSSFDEDRDVLWQKANKKGVSCAILTGTTFQTSQTSRLLASKNDAWSFTAGTHPHSAAQHSVSGWEELFTDNKCVAIGECGLDYFRMISTKQDQLSVFHWHLAQALRLNKPAFIHIRDAHAEALPILKEFSNCGGKGIVHCFTGTAAEAKAYINLGLFLGCTGWLCDERRNQTLLEAIKNTDITHWMLETDAPYLTPRLKPRLPGRNVPENLSFIAEAVASIKKVSVDEVCAKTTENALNLFRLVLGTSSLNNISKK